MAIPFWNPEEATSRIYGKVQKHSEGMISFAYKPLSDADKEAMKKTKIYEVLKRIGAVPRSEVHKDKEPETQP